ncbi:MAG TPA: hypothetical protein VN756_00775 [Solirubrobacterales bacterium]|nr:hypothetical protein [Solirubrobacterales bacterium]
MSGGSGSSSGGGFGGDSGLDCASINFDAFLSSVDPAVVKDVEEGDVLRIELHSDPRALVVVLPDERVLGAVTRKVRELLRCIQQQVQFRATIKNITGGDVEVHIEPV